MATPTNKPLPFEIRRDLLPLGEHILVQSLGPLGLATDKLVERHHGLLDDLNDMTFKLRKVILYGNEIMLVVVLLEDLLVEPVVNPPL